MADSHSTLRAYIWASLTLVALGFVSLAVDLPIARWCLADRVPKGIGKVLALSEVFGHGFGVAVILLAVVVLDPVRRWALPRLMLAACGAGLAANVVKLAVARLRPHHADLLGGVHGTFLGWLPMGAGHSYEQGCPSAHTATAVGLAVGLTWLYPRGGWLFAALVALVALQRIETGAHFVSDALWGGAIGFAVGALAVQLPSLGYLGNKLEAWGRASGSSARIARHS